MRHGCHGKLTCWKSTAKTSNSKDTFSLLTTLCRAEPKKEAEKEKEEKMEKEEEKEEEEEDENKKTTTKKTAIRLRNKKKQ